MVVRNNNITRSIKLGFTRSTRKIFSVIVLRSFSYLPCFKKLGPVEKKCVVVVYYAVFSVRHTHIDLADY